MENKLLKNNKKLLSKTILLPEKNNSDVYAVYSIETLNKYSKSLLVDGKAYKHRLYLYKKLKNKQGKILTFIVLSPGTINHLNKSAFIDKCTQIAGDKYSAFEVLSLFTFRSTDKIDAILEKSILDITRMDLSENDIILSYGDDIRRTAKHKNISDTDLKKINRVKNYKVKELLEFLKHKGNKIYTIGFTSEGNPKSILSYKDEELVEFRY